MALKVLSALDTARTQYYHFKAIIIAGMGLFTDAYDLFCIPPIMRLLGRRYYRDLPKNFNIDTPKTYEDLYEVPAIVISAMVATALLGTVIGQLVFGRLGDLMGRRRVYGLTLSLMVVSSIGCGLSMGTSRGFVLVSLGVFRFSLGVGIGGDYPLSATIISEFANKRTRGAFIAAVFSMQGFGILAGSVVTMVVCSIFDKAAGVRKWDKTPAGADMAWRIILMIGAIPAAMTCYWRMMMPETPRYTALVEKNLLQAAKDVEKVLNSASLAQIPEETELAFPPNERPSTYPLLSKPFFRRHGRDLFACAATWFLIDIVFYIINLFQSHVCDQYIPPKQNVNGFREAFAVAKFQGIVAICSTIPGYFATVYFIDVIGRVKIQILGFFFIAMAFLAMGIPYYSYWDDHRYNIGFMVLYGLTLFFSNFGPNTTTFIVPAELFPARFRSTCHGICGATGKIGAIIGSVGFLWASHNKKIQGYPKALGMTSLVILAGVCLVGSVITYFFTRETVGRSLEENEKDDEYADVCVLRRFSSSCVQPSSFGEVGAA